VNCALASAAELLFRLTQITPVFWQADELERSPNGNVGLRAGVVHDTEISLASLRCSRELDHIATARTTPLMAAANSPSH